jgi:hypothetical protein
MKDQLRRMAPGRFTDDQLDRIFDSIAANVNQSRRRTSGRFRMDAIVISMNSVLKAPLKHRYNLSQPIGGSKDTAMLRLDFDGNKYNFPAQLRTVLDAMCNRGSFRLSELPGAFNNEAMVNLAGYLQNIGFLTSVE